MLTNNNLQESIITQNEENMFLLANEDGKVGVEKAVELLNNNKTSIDAIVEGISKVEEDPHSKIVGLGGIPDISGEVTLDAAIMDGSTLDFGAVGCIKKHVNAIKIAESILHDSPHCLLVGEGADRYAKEKNIPLRSPLLQKAEDQWRELFKTYVNEDIPDSLEVVALAEWCKKAIIGAHGHLFKDTTIFMAKDHKENIAVGTSTTGWPLKYPGRLGDSPVAGAGFYANNKWGAAACTNTGEMALRANTAFAVVQYMKIGLSVEEAVYQSMKDLTSLKGGLLSDLVVHGIDKQGKYKVACYHSKPHGEPAPKFYYWHKEHSTELALIEAETMFRDDILSMNHKF